MILALAFSILALLWLGYSMRAAATAGRRS
jgi:hypothetical protein